MAGKIADRVEESGAEPVKPVQRLCNEIQLFDLCELEKCGHKQGLYCSSQELLNRFEAIAEEDERPLAAGFISGEPDDGEETDEDDVYDDAVDDDQFGDEEGYEEDLEDE
jgi:hypothetical protein